MVLKLPNRRPRLPMFLRQLTNGEYAPVPHNPLQRRVVDQMRAEGPESATRLSLPLADYWTSRQGTAAALRALEEAYGGGFYNIPEEAALDREAADEALGGDQLVIDVQTHYVSELAPSEEVWSGARVGMMEAIAADRFKGVSKLVQTQRQAGYLFDEYIRGMFLKSETDIAVLSSAPGVEGKGQDRGKRILNNAEMIATRELIERLGGTGRLINHSNVHPNVPGEIDLMDRWHEWCKPAGWKVYTLYGAQGAGPAHSRDPSWMLDDEACGLPFLQRAMDTGVQIVCAHKGLSGMADPGWNGPSSPRDIGPAAKAFPEINFLIYHSGYESRVGEREEGPYSQATAHVGTNRLIKSLKDAGIGPGGNVYAELGATWYMVMAHPREAAHVMGKLLSALGEDNILWGTDCVVLGGSPQPMIDAFRAFQIPDEYRELYRYPQLTPTAKKKILGLNAARLYGIDPEEAKARTGNDDLAWVKAALEEYKAKGTPAKA